MRAIALAVLATLILPGAVPQARADITLGAVLSLTGPGAGLGLPERNAIDLLPKTIAGQALRWVVLDDASDPTAAVRVAHKMIEEDHVDAILGPSTTPDSLAVLETVGAAGVPTISLAGSSSFIDPAEGARRWAFKPIPAEHVATDQMAAHMQANGIHTLGQIGFANALGDGYIGPMRVSAEAHGIRQVAEVRYNPTDTSVTPQVLRLMQARPDAVFVAASSSPATTPIIELRSRGYTGAIYTIQGIAGPDAIRVGGKALDGVLFSAVPVLVAEQLADDNPTKAPALAYIHAYEGKYGPGTRSLFAATLWDGVLMIEAAAPKALQAGAPGSPEFRTALRDSLEQLKGLHGTEAVFTLSPRDHSGAEPDSQVMVEIRDGSYRLAK